MSPNVVLLAVSACLMLCSCGESAPVTPPEEGDVGAVAPSGGREFTVSSHAAYPKDSVETPNLMAVTLIAGSKIVSDTGIQVELHVRKSDGALRRIGFSKGLLGTGDGRGSRIQTLTVVLPAGTEGTYVGKARYRGPDGDLWMEKEIEITRR